MSALRSIRESNFDAEITCWTFNPRPFVSSRYSKPSKSVETKVRGLCKRNAANPVNYHSAVNCSTKCLKANWYKVLPWMVRMFGIKFPVWNWFWPWEFARTYTLIWIEICREKDIAIFLLAYAEKIRNFVARSVRPLTGRWHVLTHHWHHCHGKVACEIRNFPQKRTT